MARTIQFGYHDLGLTIDLIIKRASDGKYWDGVGWVDTAPSPPLGMSVDTELQQYYSDEAPTARAVWSAIDQGSGYAVSYGEYGGGFPAVTAPPSASQYTVQEAINRIRTEIRDPDGNLFTDTDILNMLDRCHEWIVEQLMRTQTTLGLKRADYLGDGTIDWGLPADFYGFDKVVNPALSGEGKLTAVDYSFFYTQDLPRVIETEYFALEHNTIRFWSTIGTGETMYAFYYYKPIKLSVSDPMPLDGIFMNLMVEWAVVRCLNADEFDVSLENRFLSVFMIQATDYMQMRGTKRKTGNNPLKRWKSVRQGMNYFTNRRGRGDARKR